jgi:hypothetical protein
MGILRRGRGPEGPEDDLDLDPEAGLAAADAAPDDGEQGPLGPTGRPLHPVGAYFEAAFRRFGVNFGGYLLLTAICGLPWAFAEFTLDGSGLEPQLQLLIRGALLSFGLVVLTAAATALVAGGIRGRAGSVAIACLATAIPASLVVWNLSALALAPILPLVLLPPIIAVSGDADGLRAVAAGVAASGRWFRRAYACVLGVVFVAVGLWIGFTTVAFVITGPVGDHLRIVLTMLFLWPIAALVFRNLYGDMTGRLVINAAPRENEYRKDLARRKRERAKRNRRRIRRITEE